MVDHEGFGRSAHCASWTRELSVNMCGRSQIVETETIWAVECPGAFALDRGRWFPVWLPETRVFAYLTISA